MRPSILARPLIRRGEFEHSIRTHGIYGGRSSGRWASGRWAMVGDPVVLRVPHGLRPPTAWSSGGRFRRPGGSWSTSTPACRSCDDGVRSPGETGRISEYAALFWSGPDRSVAEVPLCSRFRVRDGR